MINKKRLILIVVIIAALSAYVITSGGLKNFLENSSLKELKLQNGVSYRLESFKNDVLLINNEELIAVKKNGEKDFSFMTGITEPAVSVRGDYILISDPGSSSAFLYKKDKLVKKFSLNNNILAAKVNKKGYCVIATEETGYKGMFTVFSPSGAELFRWHSGTGYIADVDISPKNKVCASQISFDGESDKIVSKILTFNTNNEKSTECLKKDGELLFGVEYYGDESFCAVSEKALYSFNSKFKNVSAIDYKKRVLQNYNISNKHNLVLCFKGNINNTLVENYSFDGKLKGSYSSDYEISSFDVSGELTLLSAGSSVYIINSSGKLKAQKNFKNDVAAAKFFPERKKLFILTGNKSVVYVF